MSRKLLRRLPAIDAWLSSEQGKKLCAEYSRDEVVVVMRAHLDRVRRTLQTGMGELPDFSGEGYTNLLRADLIAGRTSSLRPVINATGIVIHTNLGRAPLAPEAIAAIRDVAGGYSNLEFDLDQGKRGSRNAHAEGLLCQLTGAEAALVVNNCAAAVLLALKVLAGTGDVVVSRGELIEIGGSFRMPDVIAESGARMVEVGTTNRTTLRDYESALTDETRVLLTSHPSNYRVVGFTSAPLPHELSELAERHNLVLVTDLGSGSLCRLDALSDEPTVSDCIGAGAGVVMFSGDKLLGGPQAGLIVGRADLIARLRPHALARALRIDKLSLAALTATLTLYKPPNNPVERVPVLRMIAEPVQRLARRAGGVAKKLNAIDGVTASPAEGVSFAGGGSAPMHEFPTRVIRLEVAGMDVLELAARLRSQPVPVVGRINRDAFTIDLRTVLPAQTQGLVDAVKQASS
jgi:L-seryl-tRNA(Ser) seleniumtransferase